VNTLGRGSNLSDPDYVRKAAALGEGRRVRGTRSERFCSNDDAWEVLRHSLVSKRKAIETHAAERGLVTSSRRAYVICGGGGALSRDGLLLSSHTSSQRSRATSITLEVIP